MIEYRNEILGTVIVMVALMLLNFIASRIISRFGKARLINPTRKKIISKINNLIIYGISLIVLAAIWGVESKQLIVFISSILTILGIGFFAQWSILSNLTAGLILFFNHPIRIGNKIRILDKDMDYKGEVTDITGFFLHMKTEKGENLIWPNSRILEKGVEILEDSQ
ncbi:mechanosensitive ion channel [Muricauda sp. 2012CJ35-5]|uniref:Mechanosensitive ion channel n=1 Tax=Flagellimonas spongiicola TaxID=2942208 RepID=A0ABT0PPQ8_9FLAO|nr:mechanosensitive ion channel domain-containing protein [Allomuricauda spongiicola]MCL6273360.1 mechanosensitive ion channel [Allomuricauda spongiicola]